MLKIKTNQILFLLMGLLLSACGSPKEEFRKVIEEEGYITYNSPLESAGVGTIIKGRPSAMRVATRPERCFPNRTPEGNETGLRWVSKTDLPSVYKTFQLGFNAELSDIMTGGNFLLSLNLNYNRAKQVQVKFEGASIEYLDEYNFYYYYNFMMSDFCRQLLKESPFIVQALRIEKMSFKFFEENGTSIQLSPGMVGEMLNIGAGVDWKIQNNYELVVSTPKYIGYQVGFMDSNNAGKIGFLANKVDDDEYDFEAVDEVPVPVSNKKSSAKLSMK